jgi:ferrous iron transport protein B
VDAFFPKYKVLIITGLYLLGIITGIVVALIFKKTLFRGEPVPFVMELPNYRLPGLRNVLQLLWEKAKDFLQRAFTVILIATIVIWLTKSFDFRLQLVADEQDSILATISGVIAPILSPLGLGDWQISTALFSGFIAKESVVSTLEVLDIGSFMTTAAAASMLVFSLLYTPCVAAVASIRRELGRKHAIFVVVWQLAVAWVAAFAAYMIFRI